MDKTQKPKWSDIRAQLQLLGKESLISLVKDLYGLSGENKRFLESRFAFSQEQNESVLADYKQQITYCFFGKSEFSLGNPKLREARKLVSNYRKATEDLLGTLDLMLHYVETGTHYTNNYGDIDEPFYSSLESMLNEFRDTLYKLPDPETGYKYFAARFSALYKNTYGIGWGYGDFVNEVLGEMDADFEEAQDDEDDE